MSARNVVGIYFGSNQLMSFMLYTIDNSHAKIETVNLGCDVRVGR